MTGWRGLGMTMLLLAGIAMPAVPAEAQDKAEPGLRAVVNGAYRRPLGGDPATLDPVRTNDIYGRAVTQQIFDGLVQFDQTLTISPALAQYWRASRDGLTWTFTVRKGVKFHHGREVNAEDVVYSLTRILDPRLRSDAADLFAHIKGAADFREGRAKSVAGLVALDRHTVQVTLDEAQVAFVSLLALGHARIVPKDVVDRLGEAFGTHPVGTGPFKFVRWERGKEIVLAANPDAWDGAPRLARLVYRIFPGEAHDLICQEFEQGQLDESPVPPACRNKTSDPRYQYMRRSTFTVRFYGLNTRMRGLDDALVRRAIAHALDRERTVQEIFLGRHQPARGILPPGMPGYNPGLRAPGYSVAEARELLKRAGHPDGRGIGPLTIWSAARGERIEQELGAVKRQLAAIGIAADVRYETDWPTFTKALGERKYPMFVYAWHADVPDPDNFLHKLFYSKSARNLTGYANPIVDDLLLRAREEPDLGRRIERYRRAEQIIVEDAPVIPVWHYTFERLFQSYVRNVEVNGLGDAYLPLRKMWLEAPR
jgi:peptide/nickel transport system substrate-binding protein/oligopeptide transport system substrate-binding protein